MLLLRSHGWRFILLFSLTSTWGCGEVLHYPHEEPLLLMFEELEFRPMDSGFDSLHLTMRISHEFEIGLAHDGFVPPFHPFNVIIDAEDSLVNLSGDAKPPLFEVDPFGNRTLFRASSQIPPFNCTDYTVLPPSDTIHISLNLYRHNLHVAIVDASGAPVDANLVHTNCPLDLGGRIPPLCGKRFFAPADFTPRQPFTIRALSRYDLRVRYSMVSANIEEVLNRGPFQLEFFVIDKELNVSQPARTGIVTLDEITVLR